MVQASSGNLLFFSSQLAFFTYSSLIFLHVDFILSFPFRSAKLLSSSVLFKFLNHKSKFMNHSSTALRLTRSLFLSYMQILNQGYFFFFLLLLLFLSFIFICSCLVFFFNLYFLLSFLPQLKLVFVIFEREYLYNIVVVSFSLPPFFKSVVSNCFIQLQLTLLFKSVLLSLQSFQWIKTLTFSLVRSFI